MNKQKSLSEAVLNSGLHAENLPVLKAVADLDKDIISVFGNLIVANADETQIKEIAELWANHASIQYLNAPEKYNFSIEKKDWKKFVTVKLEKRNNLLLVAHDQGKEEIKGFLYLQTVLMPSSELILKGVIEDIYTKPQYRRQSIASKLLDVAIEWCIKNSISQVDLVSLKNTKDLSEFFKYYRELNSSNVELELVTF